jgi:trans-2,3-dihydro-3-hydroxyanthranilate isomerase
VTHRYVIADVFTSTPLEGNPLGVFTDGDELDGTLMQRVARELNLSETVFVLPATDPRADARVRIFTPGSELPFAGHPVLGTAFVLGDERGMSTVRLETGAGVIPIDLTREAEQITFGEMEQPVPAPRAFGEAEALLAALGVERSELPIEAYQNGPLHVYVALDSETAVAAVRPDLNALDALGPITVSVTAGEGTRFKTRVFCPGLGVPEDPATGSAAGPLAVHMIRHDWAAFEDQLEIRQGEEIARPSRLYARVVGTEGRVEHVFVGGSAVVVASGEYRLQ